ncbi:MAG: hypothetical protein JJU10_07815 [Idiomarina sp.]|nr:hypothetical protein [Idiomarina sp.]
MLWFSSKNIEELQEFSPNERIFIIHQAAKDMPFGRRAVATVLKLILLIALFWSLLYVPGMIWKILSLLAVGLLYPLVLFPVTLTLARPYLKVHAQRFKANREYARNEPGSDNNSSDEESQ